AQEKQKKAAKNRDGQPSIPRPAENFGMGKLSFRSQQNHRADDDGHRAEIEEPLDNVNRNLRAQRQPGLLGNQVGANRVSYAPDESHGGEADHLRAEQREESNLFVVPDQQAPTRGAEEIGRIDAANRDGNLAPVSQCELGTKNMEAEVNPRPPPQKKDYQRREHNQPHFPLALLQAISTSCLLVIECMLRHAMF